MRLLARLLPILTLALLLPSAAQGLHGTRCERTDKACLVDAMKAHAIHRLGTWSAIAARPLAERIEAAPPLVVEYLNLDNLLNAFPERPQAGEASPRFVAEVKAAIADLPQGVNLLFVDRLLGIFLVRDLGGTGFTSHVNDAAGNPIGGIIVLDESVLQGLSANAWATWKERSPFKDDPAWRLDARIEDGGADNRRNAIQYILLHELGHVLSIGGTVHPPWQVAPKDQGDVSGYAFFNLSWRLDAARNRYASVFDEAFKNRADVAYYFGAKLAGADMADTYSQLAKTNFPSLYAATRPGDDFAESFASYVHVVLMRKPWDITITRNGETVQVFKSCWDEARCAEKRRLLEDLAGKP